MEKEAQKFIDDFVKIKKELRKKAALAHWNATNTGKPKFYKEQEKYELKIDKLYHNKEKLEKIRNFLKSPELKDPILRRQLLILNKGFLISLVNMELIKELNKKSTKLSQKFNTFRATIDKKKFTDNDILEILKNETDSKKLEEAWEASKKQGELVSKGIIEIVKIRNKMAKQIGFNNYYEMSLKLSEQSEREILEVFNEMERLTNKPFREMKGIMDSYLAHKYKINRLELKPWHYQDLFFQEGPEIFNIDADKFYKKDIVKMVEKFYDSIGLDIRSILKKSDLYERKGKYQHAYCIDIDREGDIRILENIKNTEKWTDTTLHEFGHGVYDKYFDMNLPYILRTNAHIFVTEAIAMLFGRNSKNPHFMKKYANAKDDYLKKISSKLHAKLRMRQLVFARWSLVMFNFERLMYKNPDQDLNKLWWNLVKKYQLINFSRDKPDWASKTHILSAPVYYHNYLLGEMLASQIHNHLVKNILNQKSLNNYDYSGNKQVGEYLVNNIFKHGRKYPWRKLIVLATGEKLTPKYYVEQFVK